jgi:hypothetical protein
MFGRVLEEFLFSVRKRKQSWVLSFSVVRQGDHCMLSNWNDCYASGQVPTRASHLCIDRTCHCGLSNDRIVARCLTASVCSFIEMDKANDRQIAVMPKEGICKTGNAIVVVTGTIRMKGATNLMRVQYA